MGKRTRQRPKRLPKKLLQIRRKLALSQNEMVRKLGLADEIARDYISKYERGTLEPTLIVLLEYARVAGICVDALIDDKLDLPAKLPSVPKHEVITRVTVARPRLKKR